MSARKKKLDAPVRAPRARNIRGRQRQRLIDACISALHIYGPSRTTVEKVVAIAKMSPGIVRFYFDSKAAMLVASLQFLAAEFEEQVLVPVAKLKARPVAALELMVDLYLDPDIASPRKVSVWYAFWGEASSRQEYYDICGQKDESFAALVRELIGRLVEETSQPHLDPDAIALGLIGALEMMWQDFAFRSEADIDRQAAKRRCMAYLRSIFPGQFSHPPTRDGGQAGPAAQPVRFAGWVYASARAHALEREAVFHSAWQVAGHESQIARAGEYFTVDTGAERALLVRDSFGRIHALRNSCPVLPHTLVTGGSGRFDGTIACTVHGLKFALDGRRADGGPGIGLSALDLQVIRGLLIVRSRRSARVSPANPGSAFESIPPGLVATGPAAQTAVAADWKLLVEQWLDSAALGTAPTAAAESLHWTMPAAGARRWSCAALSSACRCRRGRLMADAIHRTESIAAAASRRGVDSAGDAGRSRALAGAPARLYGVRGAARGARTAVSGGANEFVRAPLGARARGVRAARRDRLRLSGGGDAAHLAGGRLVSTAAVDAHSDAGT